MLLKSLKVTPCNRSGTSPQPKNKRALPGQKLIITKGICSCTKTYSFKLNFGLAIHRPSVKLVISFVSTVTSKNPAYPVIKKDGF